MNKVVEVEDLRKTYGPVVAVDGVSLEVKDGEIYGLLGPNGAGKTTIVECLQGLRRADSGRISVLGLDPMVHSQQLRRKIGAQLQESALPDRIKVWEALDLFGAVADRAVDWHLLLEQWGLSGKHKASFGSLSGGQRQRLLVALALVNSPRLIFLDEMTTGLDPAARHIAWDLIRAIRNKGTTVVLVTHFMEEAEALCDSLAVIDRGKLIAADSPHRLISAHAGDVLVSFSTKVEDLSWLGSLPHLHRITRRGDRVEVEGDSSVLAHVAAALLQHGIEPDDLRMTRATLEDVFLKLTGHTVGD